MAIRVPTTWVVVAVCLLGVATRTEAVDLGVCQNSCSAVPQDLWPYCCETHHTCCEKFADSCIHDCLPRVSTGDISAVEERPGLCCALYNLCCFRETPRISSIRNDHVMKPQNFPITHRFSTLPGGPSGMSQSSVVLPQETQKDIPAAPAFQEPQANNDNRRTSSAIRPKPARKPSNSFRDATRSNPQEDVRTGTSNTRNDDDKRPSHRFDARASTPTRPSLSQNSEPQAKSEETKEVSSVQNSPHSSKLQKLNRPGSPPRPVEARKINTPNVEESVERRKNINTAKILVRPSPRAFVKPEPIANPTNPRQLNKPDPKAKINEQNTEEEQTKTIKPSFPSRPLQLQPLTQTKPTDQSSAETSPIKSTQEVRTNKFVRPGPLVRLGETRKEADPAIEVTEEPEQIPRTETAKRPQSLKLLRPNIKPSLIRNVGSDSDSVKSDSDPAKQSLKDTTDAPLALKRPNVFLQDRTQKIAPARAEETATTQAASTNTETEKSTTPIRKIKRIRTRRPNKVTLSQNTKEPPKDSDASDSQKVVSDSQNVNIDTTTAAAPTTRSQVSRGRSRGRQAVTTSSPQVTQVTEVRSRSNTRVTEGRSRSNTQVTQERTRSRSQDTQEETTHTTQATRGRTRGRTRSRSRSQATTSKPTETTQARTANEKTNLPVQNSAKNSYLPLPKVEEMMKEVPETTAEIPMVKEEKIMKAPQATEKKKTDAIALPEKSNDSTNETPLAPLEPREQPVNRPRIKKIKLLQPRVESQPPSSQQPQDVKEETNQPEEIPQTEEPSKVKKAGNRLTLLRRNSKPQQVSQQSSEPQPPRQGSQPQASSGSSNPQITRPSSQPATRQSSEPQPPRQGSQPQASSGNSNPQITRPSSQPATRQRSEPQQVTRQRSEPQVTTQTLQPVTSQRSKPQQVTRQRSEPQVTTQSSLPSTRQRSEPQQVTRQRSEPQVTTQSSQPAIRQRSETQQVTGQLSEPQQPRQRSSATPTTTRGSGQAPRQSRARSRGLTARQRIALANQA